MSKNLHLPGVTAATTNTSQSALLQTKRRARTEATSSPTRMPTSSDPAEGSFLPRESDPTGFMAGVEEVRRTWGSGGGGLKGGGAQGGGAGAVRDGREGDGEMHLSEDRVRNTRGTFFPQPLQTSTIPIPDPTCMLLYPRHATVSQCTTHACHCPGSSSRQHA